MHRNLESGRGSVGTFCVFGISCSKSYVVESCEGRTNLCWD